MKLIPLQSETQLNDIVAAKNIQIILKHNVNCSISQGVTNRLQAEREGIADVDGIRILDLVSNRDLSNAVAGRFGVPHQSPQVLVIKNGKCVYHEWGYDISAEALRDAVEKA